MREPVQLSRTQCLELLERQAVGRVTLTTPMGPRILPVNYVVRDDAIWIRTTPYSQLGTFGPGAVLAFEVDELDAAGGTACSVVAQGPAELVADADELAELERAGGPRPWASGRRDAYLRLRIRELTGRRVGEREEAW